MFQHIVDYLQNRAENDIYDGQQFLWHLTHKQREYMHAMGGYGPATIAKLVELPRGPADARGVRPRPHRIDAGAWSKDFSSIFDALNHARENGIILQFPANHYDY